MPINLDRVLQLELELRRTPVGHGGPGNKKISSAEASGIYDRRMEIYEGEFSSNLLLLVNRIAELEGIYRCNQPFLFDSFTVQSWRDVESNNYRFVQVKKGYYMLHKK